jgi:excisionase family DNA binding protein
MVFQSGEAVSDPGGGGAGDSSRVPELVRHLTVALSNHVRGMHREGLAVPHEVEELTSFFVHIARIRQDATPIADGRDTGQYASMPDRLLITKGEVAERLSVSVRTIERLVATGRLPQVYVEHSARFRVTDLEAYVNSLTESQSVAVNDDGPNDGP